jgi:hypothetical protein
VEPGSGPTAPGSTTSLVARARRIAAGSMKAPTEAIPSSAATVRTAIAAQATRPLWCQPSLRRRYSANATTKDVTKGTATMIRARAPLTSTAVALVSVSPLESLTVWPP